MMDRPSYARRCDTVLYYTLMLTGMSRWIPVIVGLLHQYEGIEGLLGFEEEFPINALTRVSTQIPHWPVEARDKLMIDALIRLPFLYFRARRGDRCWHPLEMTWKDFVSDDRSADTLVCWMCPEPDPSPNELRDWVLMRLSVVYV